MPPLAPEPATAYLYERLVNGNMGFDITGWHPYHIADPADARAILEHGLHGGTPAGVMAEVRRALDEHRPDGLPAHSESAFFHDPSVDTRYMDGVRIGVIPDRVRGTCVMGDRRIVDEVGEYPKGSDAEARVARRYWRTASVGRMPELRGRGREYSEPEIFCEPPVRPDALFRTGVP